MEYNQSLIAELLEHYGAWFRDEDALRLGRMTAELLPSFIIKNSDGYANKHSFHL